MTLFNPENLPITRKHYKQKKLNELFDFLRSRPELDEYADADVRRLATKFMEKGFDYVKN